MKHIYALQVGTVCCPLIRSALVAVGTGAVLQSFLLCVPSDGPHVLWVLGVRHVNELAGSPVVNIK